MRAFFNMKLNREQLNDIRCAVTYYRNRQISARNPRYEEFDAILDILELEASKIKEDELS